MPTDERTAEWIFDHDRGEWVYGYLVQVGSLRGGTVLARLEHVPLPESRRPGTP